jgi:hypothetical protein
MEVNHVTTRRPPTDRGPRTAVAGPPSGSPASTFPGPSGDGPAPGFGTDGPRHGGGATTADTADTTETAARPLSGADRAAAETVGQLVTHASQQLGELVRMELRLAATEMREKGRHAGIGAGLFGGAAVVALYGAGAVIVAAIAALALVLPVWASALIVGVLLFIVAAAMLAIGRQEVTRAVPPVPDETLDSAKQDVTEITERVRR